MQVNRIRTWDDLESLASDWNCLTHGVPFRGWQWLSCWWKHFGPPHEPYVLTVRDGGGTLVGIAPWLLVHSPTQGRTLRFLGSGSVCSDYLSVLSTEGHEDGVLAAIAHWMGEVNRDAASHADRWDLLELDGVAATDRVVAKLIEQLVEHSSSVHRRGGLNCWRIELPPTWDEYLGSVSKSHRKQIRRVETRLLDTGRATLHTVEHAEELSAAMATLIDLHQRRRQSLGQPGCFADSRFESFLRDVAARSLDHGQLELHVLNLDGRPVAAEFHLVGGRVAFAYQAGLDPDALDDEPGRVMNVVLLKRAIERGYRAFDYLRGDEPYKAHWRAEPRALVQLRVVPGHAAARIRHGVWLAGDAVKHLVRTSLNLTGMH